MPSLARASPSATPCTRRTFSACACPDTTVTSRALTPRIPARRAQIAALALAPAILASVVLVVFVLFRRDRRAWLPLCLALGAAWLGAVILYAMDPALALVWIED